MKIAVFGLGYVGTVTAACFAHLGHHVVGIDIDAGKVAAIEEKRSPVSEERLDDLVAQAVDDGRLRAMTQICDELDDADMSVVCVGTPSTSHGDLDTTALRHVGDDIGRALARRGPGHLVVFRSTVLPGTVESVLVPVVEQASGLRAGEHFSVAMCPEFLRESTAVDDFFDPPFTVVGTTDCDAARQLEELFAFLEAPLIITEIATAEALKYACNAFHAVKVSFANEVGRFCREVGADSRSVMNIFCKDDRLNLSSYYLRPGFSFGGSCLPKDVRALNHRSRMLGLDLPLLSNVLTSNDRHLRCAIERILASGVRSAALFGLSFKTGTDDMRESPYVELAETLLGKGVSLSICDPDVDPAALRGANLSYVADRLPHLAQLLTTDPYEASRDAECIIVASTQQELQDAVLDAADGVRVFDLVGSLDPKIERRPGFEGLAW